MKKITKRRFIALLRKYRILKCWNTKPCLCATVAVLSLVMLVMLFKKPDTVSAIADLCMAGAAIFAAYNAKDWLQPKIDEDAYKIAKEIIVENYTNAFNIVNELQNSTLKYSHHYEGFYSHLQKKNTDQIKNNSIDVKEKSIIIDKIKKDLILLKKIGYTFKNDLKKEHDEFIKLIDDFFNECDVFWSKCSQKENEKEKNKNFFNEKQLQMINLEITSSHSHLSNRYNLITKKYNSFVINELNVMDYFKKNNR